ncbi:MAG: hypothetical protein IT270_20705 [Saprospiraceae bacterium]|nr:hypothetical protein [Saprospiraceae bacterium]
MNNFTLEIWDDESHLVTFYTVRNDKDPETGGVKSATSAQESERLVYYFHQANTFAKRIEEALHDEMIVIHEEDDRLLVDFQGSTELYI